MYDVVIIGAGPAGLTAAIYAARAEKRVLVLEKENFGGQITYSPKVENYPGIASVSGNELAEKMLEQAMSHGVDIELCEAIGVRDLGEKKVVETTGGDFETKTVIIAAGSKHRRLGVPGEEELIGEGVSYCAVCDGAFYKGKEVAVIGGGNTALQDAVLLSETCRKVTIIQNMPTLTGEHRLEALLRSRENVEIMCGCSVSDIASSGGVIDAVNVKTADGEAVSVKVDGVFVAIGQVPENEPFARVASLDKRGYIVSDESCTTITPGIYAAGDCRTKEVRQVTTATADGAAAALAAIRYIDAI